MATDTTRRMPEIVFVDGKPTKVILDIERYQELLELVNDLVDLEELHRLRLSALSGGSGKPSPVDEQSDAPPAQSILEMVQQISASVPEEEWAKLPTDLSRNFRHYLYGAPKEDS